ncbi:retrovirus-related pol polyprotein from transposon TNT 1-94 [Tanacetum coccineum]
MSILCPQPEFDKDILKTKSIGYFNSAINQGNDQISKEHAMKVWTLVNLPNGKRAIGTKWVFRNKKDGRGIVVRNKARLVAQSYTQEEVLIIIKVFAPDARNRTIQRAEAVNTACYVLNRVLVTKPHNKTPYELIIGRPPSISFMRPFGCPVTILNTLDPLGKFDGKAEEGFLVGYSVNSKALNILKPEKLILILKPENMGQGPNWLFDIDSLTNSMNYQPVTAGNQTNKNAGPQEANGNTGLKQSVDAGQSEEKNVSTQQYIVFPLWSSISSSYKSSDETYRNDTADDAAGETHVKKPASENEQALKNVLDKMMDQEKEATEQLDAVRKEFEEQFNRQTVVVNLTTEAEYIDASHYCGQGRLMVFKCSGVYISALWIEVGMDYNWWQSQAPRYHGGAPAQTRSERVLEQPIEPPLSEGNTSGSGEGRMEHKFELTANVPIILHDSPLLGGYTPGSDEDRLKLQELMTMCTKLSKHVA